MGRLQDQSGCHVDISDKLSDEAWDAFLRQTPWGQYEQTSLWARVKAYYGWKPIRITLIRQGQIVAGVQVLTQKVPLMGSYGYVSRGPVIGQGQEAVMPWFMERFCRIVRQERIQYLIMQPPDRGHGWIPHMRQAGFRKGSLVSVFTASMVLDLRPGEDALFNNLRKSTRKAVRRAQQAGISVRDGSREDIQTLFEMMVETCARQGVGPNPPDVGFFHRLWDVFQPRGHLKMFVAERRQEVVSASLVVPFGNTVRGWKVGWSGNDSHLGPNHLLFWEMIRWSRSQGYIYFDLVGFDRQAAEAMAQGKPFSGPKTGAYFFKAGFGGQPVLLPEAYSFFYNPVMRKAYDAFSGMDERYPTLKGKIGKIRKAVARS